MQAVIELGMEELNEELLNFLKNQFKNAKLKIIIKEDETQYLLKNESNKKFLLNSIEELKKQIKFDVENLKRHWRDNVGRAAEV